MVGDDVHLQCWTAVDVVKGPAAAAADTNASAAAANARYKTCYTAGVARLPGPRHVWIKDLYGHDISTVEHSSFFGVVKIAP